MSDLKEQEGVFLTEKARKSSYLKADRTRVEGDEMTEYIDHAGRHTISLTLVRV